MVNNVTILPDYNRDARARARVCVCVCVCVWISSFKTLKETLKSVCQPSIPNFISSAV